MKLRHWLFLILCPTNSQGGTLKDIHDFCLKFDQVVIKNVVINGVYIKKIECSEIIKGKK